MEIQYTSTNERSCLVVQHYPNNARTQASGVYHIFANANDPYASDCHYSPTGKCHNYTVEFVSTPSFLNGLRSNGQRAVAKMHKSLDSQVKE